MTHRSVNNHNYNILNYSAAVRGMGSTKVSQEMTHRQKSIPRNAVMIRHTATVSYVYSRRILL